MRIEDINNWIQPTIYHAIKEQRLKKDTGQRERERERERETCQSRFGGKCFTRICWDDQNPVDNGIQLKSF